MTPEIHEKLTDWQRSGKLLRIEAAWLPSSGPAGDSAAQKGLAIWTHGRIAMRDGDPEADAITVGLEGKGTLRIFVGGSRCDLVQELGAGVCTLRVGSPSHDSEPFAILTELP